MNPELMEPPTPTRREPWSIEMCFAVAITLACVAMSFVRGC